MDLTSFSHSPLSLLAPAVAISLAIITRRTLLSLGAGLIIGALLLCNWQPLHAAQYIGQASLRIFWQDGHHTDRVYILIFLLCLGMITSFVSLTGGTRAFADWARKRINTGRQSQILTVCLGIIIFIDDYFNALAVGSICRPLTDMNRISRAKLAYLIDSTAAPVCVLTPISSWGAYIVTLIGTILAPHGLTEASSFGAFVQMIPMNLYALLALAMVAAAAAMKLDVGPMKKHAARAAGGELYDSRRGHPPMGILDNGSDHQGYVYDLVVPVSILFVSTITAILMTGANALAAAGQEFTLLGAFENTNVNISLLAGGVTGVASSLFIAFRRALPLKEIAAAAGKGAASMVGSLYILVLAWGLVAVIDQIGTGNYLASQVSHFVSGQWLPALVFLVAGAMAFATGTSWGTFGIMLPIVADMAAATDIAMVLPLMAAVLAGSVFGDHCSPISDTTILSSTGASCHHIDHVTTQLPYCLSVAAISLVGYFVLGTSGSLVATLLVCSLLFCGLVMLLRRLAAVPDRPARAATVLD